MERIDTSVLIVGGGSVGLALSLELGLQGVPCLLLEQTDGSVTDARAGSLSLRSAEYARRWGVLADIEQSGFPQDYQLDSVFCTSFTGKELARRVGPSMADTPAEPASPTHRQRCPQMFFDPILLAASRRHGTTELRHHWRLDSFEQDDLEVVATATGLQTDERAEIHAKYLVACDGAASPIREQLGIGSTGDPLLNYSMNILLRAPRLSDQSTLGQAERYIFVGEHGSWGNITVVDGNELWRLTVILDQERVDLEGFDPHSHVRRALGSDDLDYEVVSCKPWRRSALVADTFDHWRVLIAGDAAHTMSPTGGFGMNTGLSDTVNLGWKLRAAVEGWGGEDILASYTAERRPVAVRNVSAGTRNFKGWLPGVEMRRVLEEGPEGDRIRDEIGAELLRGTHEEWESIGVSIGYRYEGSPVCVPDGTAPTEDRFDQYIPTARPGHRAPHAWLAQDRSTLDLFSDSFTLLRFDDTSADSLLAAGRERGVPVQEAAIDDPEVAELYEQPLVLVRPDGHVAWRGDGSSHDADEIWDRVRGARSAPAS